MTTGDAFWAVRIPKECRKLVEDIQKEEPHLHSYADVVTLALSYYWKSLGLGKEKKAIRKHLRAK